MLGRVAQARGKILRSPLQACQVVGVVLQPIFLGGDQAERGHALLAGAVNRHGKAMGEGVDGAVESEVTGLGCLVHLLQKVGRIELLAVRQGRRQDEDVLPNQDADDGRDKVVYLEPDGTVRTPDSVDPTDGTAFVASFEGARRRLNAEKSSEALRDKVDTLITIPNDRLKDVVQKNTSILDAFRVVDDVLRQGVQGISDIITMPGLINQDFAEAFTDISNFAGVFGYGIGDRAEVFGAFQLYRRIDTDRRPLLADGAPIENPNPVDGWQTGVGDLFVLVVALSSAADKVRLLALCEPAYPAMLRGLDDAPPILLVSLRAHQPARPDGRLFPVEMLDAKAPGVVRSSRLVVRGREYRRRRSAGRSLLHQHGARVRDDPVRPARRRYRSAVCRR